MTIYCGTDKYRKIYENHYGPIPKDETGRTYEIHHIDGDRKNNNPGNLKCVSIQEHYDIHYSQGDWAAAARIADKMKIDKETRSLLSRTHNLQMSKENRHPWQTSEFARARNKRLVEEGRHNFLGGEVQRKMNINRVKNKTHPFMKDDNGESLASKRVKEGTNPFSKRADGSSIASEAIAKGTHPTQKIWKCEHCLVEGKGASNFTRYHINGKCLHKH